MQEKIITSGADMRSSFKNRFSGKRLAFMALFVALSYAISFLEIPTPILGVPFLKLDFGNVFIVLISFLLGPIEGLLVCLLKEGLRCFTSSTFCTGELANFIITSAFLLLPSIVYQYNRTIKTVLITLPCACLIATGTALIANWFIIFPAYAFVLSDFGLSIEQAFSLFWPGVLLFNLIKTALISILTLLLYKRLSNFLKRIKI